MHIVYVIDNETHRLADVLNEVLAGHAGCSRDVATAYFTVRVRIVGVLDRVEHWCLRNNDG